MDEDIIDCRNERTVQMLYLKMGRSALSKTTGMVGKAVAEEIVQEVFAKLWQGQLVFNNLKLAYAWVYRCCTNAAIDYIRNKNNQHLPLYEIEIRSRLDLEEINDIQKIWQQLVITLNTEEAELFVFKHIEGLNQDEIAEVMQISRRTVNRIQSKLSEKLAEFRRGRYVG